MTAARLTPGVAARIASLPDLPFKDIKSLWQTLFGNPPPTHNRNFLERRIAHRWQELEFATRQPGVLERNRERIDALIARTEPRAKAGRGERVRLVPGTVLTREYLGVCHRVVALPDGQFEYRGKPYRSLTAIANEISGTRWSGPAFFGLRESGKEARR